MTTIRFSSVLAVTGMAALCLALFANSAQAQSGKSGSTAQARGQAADKAAANPKWDKYAFELPHIDDEQKVSFADIASAGRPFIVFFWRSDCPLCHMQMPYAQQLQRLVEEGQVDMKVVSICLDDSPKEALALIEEKELSFTVLFDGHGRRSEAKFQPKEIGLPLTYAFSKDGEFIDYLTGFRAGYAKAVVQLLDLPMPDELKKR